MIERPDRSFYDDPEVHRRYTAHRSDRPHRSPNHVMEEPAVLAGIGDVRGVDVLDLGCGDAAFGQVLLAAGARSYTGVDDSQLMVAAARDNLVGTTGQVVHASIATYEPDPASLDLVTARLSLHYLETVDGVLAAMATGLRPGGRFVATVVHPVITSHDNPGSGPRTTWTVDDYFVAGPRHRQWMGAEVTWHHRTVEQYVDSLLAAGFVVTAVRECPPVVARFDADSPELARRRRVPLFLLLSGRRPAIAGGPGEQ